MSDDSGDGTVKRDPPRRVGDHPSFASWEPTWRLYRSLVVQVAKELDPLASEAERNAQIVASAAAGFLDTNTIDPLVALLDGLLRGRTPSQQARAAQLLVESGIDGQRAIEATQTSNSTVLGEKQGTFAFQPTKQDAQTTQEVFDPTFDTIRQYAIGLWEQQTEPDENVISLATQVGPLRTPAENDRPTVEVARTENGRAEQEQQQEQQDQAAGALRLAFLTKRRRKITVASLLVAFVGGTVAGRVIESSLTGRSNKQLTPLLLTVKDLPKQWKLTFATAHQPAPVFRNSFVFQRFTSLDKKQTVLVSTNREDERFADAALGTRTVGTKIRQSQDMQAQAQAIASESFALNHPVMMEWKQPTVRQAKNQPATLVYLQATGMPAVAVRDFGRALRPRPDLLKKGWATPKGFSEILAVRQRKVNEGVVSSLSFLSTVDGTTRLSIQTRFLDAPSLSFGRVQTPPKIVELASGRKVKFRREWGHYYWWEESGMEFYVAVGRGSSGPGIVSGPGYGIGTSQQGENFFPTVDELPDRHLDGVLDLLNRVSLGDDEQWRSLTAGFQASLHNLQLLGTIKMGNNTIETRGIRTVLENSSETSNTPTALCAYSVCAPIYRSWNQSALEADLLIDDHWWHFRQIANYDKQVPKYLTSPALERMPTDEAKTDRVYKWWGVDFGTKTQAAHNENEWALLLRPLPR